MLAHSREFHDCYQPHAALDPSLSGRIITTFKIGVDGRATHLSATGMTDVISRCALSVIASIEFPRPVGGAVSVTYPLAFRPALANHEHDDADVAKVRAVESRLDACATKSSVHGRVVATIVTRPDGALASVALDHHLDGTPFAACVIEVLGDVAFTANHTSSDTSLTVPLRFP